MLDKAIFTPQSLAIFRVVRRLSKLDYPVLDNIVGDGFQGIEDYQLRLSQLVTDFPQISEIDINPLMVSEAKSEVTAVDCRMVIDGGE